jgi:lambda family phage portal protein
MIGELLDRLIAIPFPTMGRDRAMARARYEALSVYGAAKKDRTTRDWRASYQAGDSAHLGDQQTMIARARQVVRDTPNAASAVNGFGRNVVGNGIWPVPAIDPEQVGGKDLAESAAAAIRTEFKRWARDPGAVDIEGRKSWREIQRLAVEQMVEGGECFIVKSYRKGRRRVGLTLQILEPEHLSMDTFGTSAKPRRGNTIRNGIELNPTGAAVAYWFTDLRSDPLTGASRNAQRVPAGRVCHLMRQKRAQMSHGVTWFHPVLRELRDLAEFDANYLEASRIEAAIALVVEKNDAGTAFGPSGNSGDPTSDDRGTGYANIESGMIFEGGPGEKVTGLTPQRPNGTYADFTAKHQRSIAAGLGTDYETMARDWTGSNFSSLRQGALEARRGYEPIQLLLIDLALRNIYEEFVFWAVLERRVVAPGFETDRDPWVEALWRRPRWEWIDPQKEENAVKIALENKLTSLPAEIESRGEEWRDTLIQEKQYQDERDRMGLNKVEQPKEVAPEADAADPDDE